MKELYIVSILLFTVSGFAIEPNGKYTSRARRGTTSSPLN